MEPLQIGFALCSSFCTFATAIKEMASLAQNGASLLPIMSETAYQTNTRFGAAEEINATIERICQNPILYTIPQAEPIGPKGLLDILVVAPCTGNTLAKLAGGITDNTVTMACKSHLRNNRPVVIAISTNDGLSANLQNIGKLLARKQFYFVPFGQDNPSGKPNSLVADLSKLAPTIEKAMLGEQLEPILTGGGS